MYIQPNWGREEPPLKIPENYSGTSVTAFGERAPVYPAESAVPASIEPSGVSRNDFRAGEPTGFAPPVSDLPEEPSEPAELQEKDALPASARPLGKSFGGGLISRFPFLSTLMPPKRRGSSSTSDLLLIAGLLLLLSEEGEQDGLPLLLILLLI